MLCSIYQIWRTRTDKGIAEKLMRLDIINGEYKEVKITREEKKLILWLSLITIGFLLQLIGYIT